VLGNPIRLVDPDGRAPSDIIYINSSGVETGRLRLPGQDVYISNLPNIQVTGERPAFAYRQPAQGSIQSVGLDDALGDVGGALTVEAGKALGMDEKVVGAMATIIVIIKDAKGLNVKKTIKNLDDLMEAAGGFGKGKTKVSKNTIDGDRDAVFDEITAGGTPTKSGKAVKMDDGRVISKHESTNKNDSGRPTIDINDGGRQKKVRFKKPGEE
jgi:hypothetical protein